MTKPRADVYSTVTMKIIAYLEKGVRPWQKPWNARGCGNRISRPLRSTGEAYRGINVLLLWCEALDKGYTAATWMTYRQATLLGGHVRKGEHGACVVYADRIKKTEITADGEECRHDIPIMKTYTVFNVEQIDGLPHRCFGNIDPPSPTALISAAEAFIAASRATIKHGGNQAFYSPTHDFVQMPPRNGFRDVEGYAATLLHELTHWTSHPSRLDRMLGKRFGDEAYAAEELIAELGADFLCVDLGITAETREDHAAYVAHWLTVLRTDSRAIFTAASHAQRAADYLHLITAPSALSLGSVAAYTPSDATISAPTRQFG